MQTNPSLLFVVHSRAGGDIITVVLESEEKTPCSDHSGDGGVGCPGPSMTRSIPGTRAQPGDRLEAAPSGPVTNGTISDCPGNLNLRLVFLKE